MDMGHDMLPKAKQPAGQSPPRFARLEGEMSRKP